MRRCVVVLIAGCLAGACTGIDVGNPAKLDFAIYNHDNEPIVTDQMWVAVDRIELRQEPDCAASDVATVVLEGPFQIDLFSAEPLAADGIPAGSYCLASLVWGRAQAPLAAGAPPQFEGATALVRGTRTDATPFSIRSVRQDQLDQFPLAATIEIPELARLFEAFDAARVSNLALDEAVVQDGQVLVEAGSNQTVLDAFEGGFPSAWGLFADENDNGVLDPTEREPTDAIASGQ